ncbi:MAG: hypothetical protein WDZ28_01815 [Simkaniaceae bacterium]
MTIRSTIAKVACAGLLISSSLKGSTPYHDDGRPKDSTEVLTNGVYDNEGLSASIFGWGILLAVAISILSITLGSDDTTQTP